MVEYTIVDNCMPTSHPPLCCCLLDIVFYALLCRINCRDQLCSFYQNHQNAPGMLGSHTNPPHCMHLLHSLACSLACRHPSRLCGQLLQPFSGNQDRQTDTHTLTRFACPPACSYYIILRQFLCFSFLSPLGYTRLFLLL